MKENNIHLSPCDVWLNLHIKGYGSLKRAQPSAAQYAGTAHKQYTKSVVQKSILRLADSLWRVCLDGRRVLQGIPIVICKYITRVAKTHLYCHYFLNTSSRVVYPKMYSWLKINLYGILSLTNNNLHNDIKVKISEKPYLIFLQAYRIVDYACNILMTFFKYYM